MSRPRLVVHADWSLGPAKRWGARAVLVDRRYYLSAPSRVEPGELLADLARGALVGFDFPIGVPVAYARLPVVGPERFPALLARLGRPPWDHIRSARRLSLAGAGLLGMLEVVDDRRAHGAPDVPEVRDIEGWILGRGAGASASPG